MIIDFKAKQLIYSCYDNLFEIDLRSLHLELSSFSSIHSENGIAFTIDDPYFKNKTFIFDDGISSAFELISISGLTFLIGDKSCYPCSRVYKNLLGQKWIHVLLIPENYKISCPGFYKESYIQYNPLAIKLDVINKLDFRLYIECFVKSFSENEWYSTRWLIRFVKEFSGYNLKQKVDYLRELHLLSPLELCLASFFYSFNLTTDDIYHCIDQNTVNIQIPYLKPIPFKLNFNKSTRDILNSQILLNSIKAFSLDETETFFEIEYLREGVKLNIQYNEIIEDVFGIGDIKRWIAKKTGMPLTNHKIKQLKTYNIDEKFIMSYYKRLRTNVRTLENKLRIDDGHNIVGSLFTETLIFTQLADQLKEYHVTSQHSPKWLGRQRFDIFIHELNIAVEYNGLQHYQPVAYFGGIDGFKQTQSRDMLKRKKSRENNCVLIEIKYNADINQSINDIIGFVKKQKI